MDEQKYKSKNKDGEYCKSPDKRRESSDHIAKWRKGSLRPGLEGKAIIKYWG